MQDLESLLYATISIITGLIKASLTEDLIATKLFLLLVSDSKKLSQAIIPLNLKVIIVFLPAKGKITLKDGMRKIRHFSKIIKHQ